MNVLFLNPPFLKNFSRSQRSPAVTKSGTLYFPMWLASAAGLLESKGHPVDLIDAPADDRDLDYVMERAKKFQPGLIVVDTSTPSIANDVSVAAALKDAFPASFVVLVGTHVSALPEETLKISDKVDAVARGEYDDTLLELADTLAKKGAPGAVAGLMLRQNGGVDRDRCPPAHRGPGPDPLRERHVQEVPELRKVLQPQCPLPHGDDHHEPGLPLPVHLLRLPPDHDGPPRAAAERQERGG